jgi:hypothetical protein
MGRPRIYDEPRVATAVRLPVSVHDELQRVASARAVSVNFLVTRAVTELLTHLPDPLAEAPVSPGGAGVNNEARRR